jgi:hypothetical protein
MEKTQGTAFFSLVDDLVHFLISPRVSGERDERRGPGEGGEGRKKTKK